MEKRSVPDVNNFWKAIAHHPPTLRRTWESLDEVMAPGVLDPLTKEMLYVAISASNGCRYCVRSHTAAARKGGMTDDMLGELLAVVGMCNETNRLAQAYDVPVDPMFLTPPPERASSPADIDVRTMYRNKIFAAVQNDASGEVSDETIFRYHQDGTGAIMNSTYSGGEIVQGSIVATVSEE